MRPHSLWATTVTLPCRMMSGPATMNGEELRDLIYQKWGRFYDARLQRRGSKMYLHIMW
jgi:hypothetical protein